MNVNRPEIVAQVAACVERYERALVTNDIDVLDELFWDGPLVVRFGVAENLYGRDEIAAFRVGRPTGDLERDVLRSVITTFGTDFATASLEYRRRRSGEVGRQSQSWVRTERGWRIVAAHVSRPHP